MTPQEQGFILLSSHLGYPDRPALTPTMMKTVQQQVMQLRQQYEDRAMRTEDLLRLGLKPALASRVMGLMQDEALLKTYLKAAKRNECIPLTPFSEHYPKALWQKLGFEGPCCLWAKGELSLLNKPAVAVVGSREPRFSAAQFAVRAGQAVAENGYVLISGNARGVDELAQRGCLEAGGSVISVVADTLYDKRLHDRVLYLSEHDFDMGFSSARALSRNRVIHAMGQLTIVSQCREGRGGTWSGSCANLQNKWSPIACFNDGSSGAQALEKLGAKLVTEEDLERLIIEN